MPEINPDNHGHTIVTGPSNGLIERVTGLHAEYYSRHWGFTDFFANRVAREMREFFNRYDETRDCTWSVVVDNDIEASITIDALDVADRGAHLRWFICSDKTRGQGIGARLIDQAMAFCVQHNYQGVYLHTFKGLEPARQLYESHGFRLVQSSHGDQWGTPVEEQRYETWL